MRTETAGGPETKLGEKGPGESFGEAALLHDAPRNATVRALTAVDVLTVSRNDFKKLVASYGAVREQVERDVAKHAAPVGDGTAAAPTPKS